MRQKQSSCRDFGEYNMTPTDFRIIAAVLKKETGIFLSERKEKLVYSRLSKRLRSLGLDSFAQYCQILQSKERNEELEFLTKALTTNVTSFFREPHHFDLLRKEILPGLSDRARRGESIRLWSAGCSAGQEPYSIAMDVLEHMPDAVKYDIKILATDIDPSMVATGHRGQYSDDAVKGIPDQLRSRYFRRDASIQQWTAQPELRQLVTFRELNLFKPWPFSRKFDAIFCRNVVIYFETEDQKTLWKRYADSLRTGGYLIIGHSERLSGPVANCFQSCGLTAYRFQGNPIHNEPVMCDLPPKNRRIRHATS